MQMHRMIPIVGALAALCLATPQSTAAQEPKVEEAKQPIKVDLPPLAGESTPDDDIDAQIEKLIGDVERQLRNIDRLLENAAAGGAGAGEAAREAQATAKAMTELMKRSRAESESAVKNIDQILELASIPRQSNSPGGGKCSSLRKCQGQGSSQGDSQKPSQGQQQAQGKSPLEGSRDATTQREKTGDNQGEAGGRKDQPGGQDPKMAKAGQPQGNQRSDQTPTQQEGAPPPGSEKGAPMNSMANAETWGFLPEHARDVFRSQGGGEYPARYRDWIDNYYKKLNQRP